MTAPPDCPLEDKSYGQITLTIPESLYLMAEEVTQIQNRKLTDLLSDSIQTHFPSHTIASIVPPKASLRHDETDEAPAAVERLSTLFADASITDLEQVLKDPMLELANM